MYLDWLPIIILCFAVSVYFIAKLRTSGQRRALLIGIVLLLVVGNRMLPWPVSLQTSAGYIGTALGLLLPLFVYMYTEHMRHWNMVALAVFLFLSGHQFPDHGSLCLYSSHGQSLALALLRRAFRFLYDELYFSGPGKGNSAETDQR